MERPDQNQIETFINITGASEAIAIQKLEEHRGDLNRAINAHFNEGDRTSVRPSSMARQDDFMVIDDDDQNEPQGRSLPPLLSTESPNPFAALDHPRFGPGSPDGGETVEVAGQGPNEARQVPVRTSAGHSRGPVVHGTVISDDEEDEDFTIASASHDGHQSERPSGVRGSQRLQTPPLSNMADNGDDIEEEMVRAAIEASKREVEVGYSSQQFGLPQESFGPQLGQGSSHSDDIEFARALSESLKTAEQEKAVREKQVTVGTSGEGVSLGVNELGRPVLDNERQGFGLPNMKASSQFALEEGGSTGQEEAEDVDEPPLVRHRSRRLAPGATSDVTEPAREVAEEMEDSLSSSPVPHDITNPQPNGDAFHSEEWGGISSLEHDEAVMLEAAMFGGIPEGPGYHRFGYGALQNGSDGSANLYPGHIQRPPSPGLVAQRLLREQQDDEYLAALQADKEKELKARMEAEIRRLEEAAAREAFLQEERQREEEAQRKLLEEEVIEKSLVAKEASLPQEPTADDESAITLLVRMPDGSRRGRRFLKSDKLQSLFDFIDIGRVVKPNTYRLVRPYPRRAFSDSDSGLTLSDLGLSSKQEALFLELI